MSDTHSWDWLPPRLTGRKVRDGAADATARPCLPEVERLDDRILLSASVQTAAADTGGGTTQILIGLLRDGTDMIKGELDAVQLSLRSADPSIKIWQDFWKVDDLLFNAADAFIKGGTAKIRLDEAFKKIDEDVARLDGATGELVPAVQKVREAANKVVLDLDSLNRFGVPLKKATFTVGQIAEDFMKIDRLAYKIGVDAMIKGEVAGIKGESLGAFLGQLDDLFQKAGNLITATGDSSIIGVLLPAVQDAEKQLTSYLIGLTGGEQFPGGVSLPDGGGDVITA